MTTEDDSNYFEHEADVGIIGRGDTVEAALEQAARATFAVMADLDALEPERHVRVVFDEDDPEFALVTWLNQLIAVSRVEGLALCRFSLHREDGHWSGEAWGQPWPADLDRGVEVKGATLTMLSVRNSPDGWEARCVVDV